MPAEGASEDSSKWSYSFPKAGPNVVLGHIPVLVCEKLLRVCKVAGIGCGLGSNVSELEINLGQGTCLVEA